MFKKGLTQSGVGSGLGPDNQDWVQTVQKGNRHSPDRTRKVKTESRQVQHILFWVPAQSRQGTNRVQTARTGNRNSPESPDMVHTIQSSDRVKPVQSGIRQRSNMIRTVQEVSRWVQKVPT